MALLRLIEEGTLDEVKAYVKENPESIKEKNADSGRLVIHEALARGNQEDVEKISFILDEHPMSTAEKDSNGRLPLHYAADGHASLDIVRLLIMPFPIATRVADSSGRLPLHRAIMAERFDAATLLLKKHYGEIDATCKEGSLLHMALKYSTPGRFIRFVVEKLPRCLKMTNDDGYLPLHTALDVGASLDVVRFILNANPSALQVPTNLGELPLHREAENCVETQVLELLHTRYPQGISTMDKDGNLPIHFAVINENISTECLDFLFNAYPQGISAITSTGDSVLHAACHPSMKMIPSRTVQWIIEKCPVLVQAVDADRHFPLHYAASHTENVVDVLQLLSSKFPEALLAGDKDGDLPLHLSFMNDGETLGNFANIKFLIEQFPEGARRVNAKGQLPLHAACAFKNVPIEAIDLLVQNYPDGLAQYDKHGLLPFHHACTVPILEHVIAKLQGSILPPSKEYLPALLVACDRDAPLEVIMKLVELSKELFSGEVEKIVSVDEPRCHAFAGTVPKRRKLCTEEI